MVLKIAVDSSGALDDARTESVAAPMALAAGIRVPRLIAFDDSGSVTNRAYSLWERIHGETLGLFAPDPLSSPATWRDVGHQLALLHNRVLDCVDPHGWLDHPTRDSHLEERIASMAAASNIDSALVRKLEHCAKVWRPAVDSSLAVRFLHNDVHAMNVMCARDGSLLGLLDWGDAGWGDPALELAQVPLSAVPFVLRGYESEAHLDDGAEVRILWDKLCLQVEEFEKGRFYAVSLKNLLACIHWTV